MNTATAKIKTSISKFYQLCYKVQNAVWIAIFMQLFLAALDKIIFRDYTYNSVIYHCYIGGVQN